MGDFFPEGAPGCSGVDIRGGELLRDTVEPLGTFDMEGPAPAPPLPIRRRFFFHSGMLSRSAVGAVDVDADMGACT
jgi:hypothetical protein